MPATPAVIADKLNAFIHDTPEMAQANSESVVLALLSAAAFLIAGTDRLAGNRKMQERALHSLAGTLNALHGKMDRFQAAAK